MQAEVLGKRVVVQHIPLGGLLDWNHTIMAPPAVPQTSSVSPAPKAPPAGTSYPASGTSLPSKSQVGYPSAGLPSRVPHGASPRGLQGSSGLGATRGIIPARSPLGPTASTIQGQYTPVRSEPRARVKVRPVRSRRRIAERLRIRICAEDLARKDDLGLYMWRE